MKRLPQWEAYRVRAGKGGRAGKSKSVKGGKW